MNNIYYRLYWRGKYFVSITLPAHPAKNTVVKAGEHCYGYRVEKITMENNSDTVTLDVEGFCPF
jgi:hypothetical protein